MSDQAPPPPPPPPPPPLPAYGAPQPGQAYVGKVRSTGVGILLFLVTFGIYGLVWWYLVHEDMKRHSGQGLGGGLALVLAFVAVYLGLPVAPFFTSDEVGKLYERVGRQAPVSALTGLWYFPGMFLVVLPIVWFVKTNDALNDYWRSYGATG